MEGNAQTTRMKELEISHIDLFIQSMMKDWLLIWKQIPPEEQVDFLKTAAEGYLGELLADMGRMERAALMNGLLPLVAREFPLGELDLISAFPAPTDLYTETRNGNE